MGTASQSIGGQMAATVREAQLEALIALHETGLLRYAARILNNPTTAHDVVQNVFIKLCSHWDQGLAPTPQLKSWLYRVTHNEAVDHIRRESRLRVLHERDKEEKAILNPDCPDGESCPMSDDDRMELVLRFVHKLHPREQQVLLLRLQEGFSYREISEVTGRSEGNVGNLLHHAVRKLSQQLKKHGFIES